MSYTYVKSGGIVVTHHETVCVSAGFVVPLWSESLANEIQTASIRIGPGHTIVTLACDSGLKYLSTPLYSG